MATSCFAEDIAVTGHDLLDLEFEAIIAANYPPSTGRPLRRPPVVRRPVASLVGPPCGDPRRREASRNRIRPVGRRPHARQRSPPEVRLALPPNL
jgi:hypothetical protein